MRRRLRRAGLEGELREFAKIVGGDERTHVAYLRKALGAKARKPPKLDFGDDTWICGADHRRRAQARGPRRSWATTRQAPASDTGALAAAARIVSVEARNAAWIRGDRRA